jgi:hypothetical protein
VYLTGVKSDPSLLVASLSMDRAPRRARVRRTQRGPGPDSETRRVSCRANKIQNGQITAGDLQILGTYGSECNVRSCPIVCNVVLSHVSAH